MLETKLTLLDAISRLLIKQYIFNIKFQYFHVQDINRCDIFTSKYSQAVGFKGALCKNFHHIY